MPERAIIDIVDYGSGNIQSLRNALLAIGRESRLIRTPDEIAASRLLFFPGVGAFGYAANRLDELRLREPLLAAIRDGRPFLGICLGMQLLFERSDEAPGALGLGVFAGGVRKLTARKIPHMGWNEVAPAAGNPGAAYLAGDGTRHAYFVHSYHCVPNDRDIVAGATDYEGGFTCAVGRGNLFAIQFHPEKSGEYGLGVLRRFLEHTAC